MNALTISFNDKTSMVYQPSLALDSTIKTVHNNTRHFKRRSATKIKKDLQVQFASALVHEVRNPLTNINLAIEMLESAIEGNDLKIYVDIIRRSSSRINGLICDLLKYQEDKGPVEKCSISQLLDEVLEMAGDRMRLKKISVSKDYACNDCTIELNKLKMLIGLTNIVVNAIDAMIPGKGELKLVTKSIEGRCVIQIEDNGCGISKENLTNIFKPYFTSKAGGLGIGLAETYNILRSNNVGVNVESEEGKGTRFILTFEEKHQYSQCSN
jgi:signal transduction histidine kinase